MDRTVADDADRMLTKLARSEKKTAGIIKLSDKHERAKQKAQDTFA